MTDPMTDPATDPGNESVSETVTDTDNATEADTHTSLISDQAEDEIGADGDDAEGRDGRSGDSALIEEGDIAADYLEQLLDILDYDGDIDLDVENDRAVVAIIGSGLKALVGPRGETLDALQELTRLAVAQKTGTRSRLMLDIGGHRAARRSELASLATDTASRVLSSGESARLTPMNPFERKVVHDVVSGIDGVRSESEGEEPNRRVVVLLDR